MTDTAIRADTTRPSADALVWAPGAAERHPRRTAKRRRMRDLSLGIGVPVALILLWQIASDRGWIDQRLYPSPTTVLENARDLHERGRLWSNTWITMKRILIGYGIGTVTGVAVGLAMGMFRVLRAALEPLLNALYTVPKLALLPVFLTIFGLGEGPVNALMSVTVFFFVWISTMSAVLAVPNGYREAAQSLRVNRRQLFWHVLLPASMPQIFVGLRIAAGVSVLMVVGVEFVIAGEGLGYLIEQGRALLLLGQSFTGIVIVALIGMIFTVIVEAVGRLASPWADTGKKSAQP